MMYSLQFPDQLVGNSGHGAIFTCALCSEIEEHVHRIFGHVHSIFHQTDGPTRKHHPDNLLIDVLTEKVGGLSRGGRQETGCR